MQVLWYQTSKQKTFFLKKDIKLFSSISYVEASKYVFVYAVIKYVCNLELFITS